MRDSRTVRKDCKQAMSVVSLLLFTLMSMFLFSPNPASAANANRADKASDIEIKIEQTRPKLTVGTGFGITAEVKNISNKIIYLHEKYITMTPPPELVGATFPSGWWAHFPTEMHNEAKDQDYYDVQIAIPAGESYKVFWFAPNAPNEEERKTGESDVEGREKEKTTKKKHPLLEFPLARKIYHIINAELGFLFFMPGDYTITVAAKYWIDPQKPLSGTYHTKVESKTIPFDAPQSVILLGASIGGLISYFLLPQARRRLIVANRSMDEHHVIPLWVRNGAREIVGILGAALLSAIVTIMLARISESQFLIRVTVADFWGAIAIGFIANYAGAEVLNKIIKLPPGSGAAGSEKTIVPADTAKKDES